MRVRLDRWSLPLGLIVHPLSEADGEVPTVNLGSAGIVRCKRCRTYINPFVRWVDGGRCVGRANTLTSIQLHQRHPGLLQQIFNTILRRIQHEPMLRMSTMRSCAVINFRCRTASRCR